MIAEDTQKLVKNQFETRKIDLLEVVGKEEYVRVFELLGETGGIDKSIVDLKHNFEKGLYEYRKQAWNKATSLFETCLKIISDDGPSSI